MPPVPVLTQTWYCPNCEAAARTVDQKTPMHRCRGLAGLMIPLVREGVKAKHEKVERGDWIGTEDVQYDADRRPTMAVVTETNEGQDCTVFAPAARVGVHEQ